MTLMTNSVASGTNFHNTYDLISEISQIKGNQHGYVSYYSPEDIEQESMIKLWQVADRFNPSGGAKLRVFLSICAENRIIDIKRGLVYRHNKPCFRCPFWDENAAASGQHDCLAYREKMICDRYYKHEKNLHLKMSVNSPDSIENASIFDDVFTNNVERLELEDFIYSKLEERWHHIFDKFRDANYKLGALRKKERNLIKEKLIEIIEEYRRL